MKNIALLSILTLAARAGFAAPALPCTALLDTGFGPEVKIESAKLIPAAPKTPEHCEVRGTIWPENQFALKLPAVWNKRFYMVGNGGTRRRYQLRRDGQRTATGLCRGVNQHRP